MLPSDGKALIWYVWNSLYFEQDLENHPRVRLLHYNDIASRPSEVMQSIYAFIDVDYPSDEIIASIHGKSVGLGKEIKLNPHIEALCEELWRRFLAVRKGELR